MFIFNTYMKDTRKTQLNSIERQGVQNGILDIDTSRAIRIKGVNTSWTQDIPNPDSNKKYWFIYKLFDICLNRASVAERGQVEVHSFYQSFRIVWFEYGLEDVVRQRKKFSTRTVIPNT